MFSQMGFWDMGSGWMNGWGFGMLGLPMLLFWGLVIWLGVTLFRRVGRTNQPIGQSNNSAVEILAERYARGELSRTEFEEMGRTVREQS